MAGRWERVSFFSWLDNYYQIYYFKFPSGVEAVTVDAYTESDICAFVSVQSNLVSLIYWYSSSLQ